MTRNLKFWSQNMESKYTEILMRNTLSIITFFLFKSPGLDLLWGVVRKSSISQRVNNIFGMRNEDRIPHFADKFQLLTTASFHRKVNIPFWETSFSPKCVEKRFTMYPDISEADNTTWHEYFESGVPNTRKLVCFIGRYSGVLMHDAR